MTELEIRVNEVGLTESGLTASPTNLVDTTSIGTKKRETIQSRPSAWEHF